VADEWCHGERARRFQIRSLKQNPLVLTPEGGPDRRAKSRFKWQPDLCECAIYSLSLMDLRTSTGRCQPPKAEPPADREADQSGFFRTVVVLRDKKHIALGEVSTLAIDHESEGRSRQVQDLAFDPSAVFIGNLRRLNVDRLLGLQSAFQLGK
jgi:hypothetical protein